LAEGFIEAMYAMAGVFAMLVVVLFSVRGGRYLRRSEEIEREEST